MKKSIVASALALSIVGLAACTEEAKADVALFGSVEQRVELTDGVTDVVNDDTYFGVRATETFGESGNSAFAVISLDVNTEGANASNTKDAYAGLNLGGLEIQAGRFATLTKSVADSTIDPFEGNGVDTIDDGRANNNVRVSVGDAVKVTAQITSDGTAGEKTVDTQAVGVSTDMGVVGLSGVYSKDKVNNTDTYLVAATTDLGGISLGGAFERADSGSTTTDTVALVASMDVAGNTLTGGYSKADGDDALYAVELGHSFSKSTSAYVNYYMDDNNSVEDTLGVGMRMTF